MARELRWGVLGSSGIARAAVIPAIQASRNGRVAAVASRDRARAQSELQPLGVEQVLGSYEELLAVTGIDAVYIPLPNSLHSEWSIRAAEAGKAVLVEKPMARSAKEAAELVAAVARTGVPFMEGFMYRFHPQHQRVKGLIAEGAIGEVREVRAHLSVDIMSPADPQNVRFVPGLGGGALLDMGCYVASVARMIFGEEPLSVRGWWHVDERFGVDVSDAAVLEFSGGRAAVVSCSFAANGQGHYSVIGREGMIESPRGIILGLGTRVPEALVIVVDADGRRREETLPADDHYRLMAEGFADAVLSGKPVPLPPDDGVRNLKVLDAWARSARGGRTEKIA